MTPQQPTDTESVVERGARAIREKLSHLPPYGGPRISDHLANELARLVIKAMREPTDDMTLKGSCAKRSPETAGAKNTLDRHFGLTRDIWSAMIDAALSEPLPEDGK